MKSQSRIPSRSVALSDNEEAVPRRAEEGEWKRWMGGLAGWFRRTKRPDLGQADSDGPSDLEESSQLMEWQDSLLFQKEELLRLTNDIELDFLGLGESMKEMSGPVRKLRGHCETVVKLASSGHEGHAVKISLQILEKSEELTSSSQDQFDNVAVFFLEFKKKLLEMAGEQENLGRALRSLPCIIVNFKIHSSMLDEGSRLVFATLTAEMQIIMNRLGSAVEKQLHQIKRLEQAEITVSRLIVSLSGQVMQHKQEVASHSVECRSNLQRIRESMQASGDMITEIFGENKEVWRHSSNVVVSLQCQDRVRQKVEHVGAAMDEMVAQLGQFLEMTLTESLREEAKLYLKEAACIQLRQVDRIMDELRTSAKRISIGIDGIEHGAHRISKKALLTAENSCNQDVVRRVADDIEEILSVIRVTVDGVDRIRTVVAPFEADFTDSSSEIRGLALDIRFVSLNAQIYAEHFDGGQALATLSNILQEISDRASGIVAIISNQTEALQGMLANLNQRLADFDLLAGREKSFLEVESLLSMKQLEEAHRELKALLSQILLHQKEIEGVHHRAAARLKFPELVEASSQKAVRYFEKLIKWGTGKGVDAETVGVVARRIEQLKKNYTMAEELEVHELARGLFPLNDAKSARHIALESSDAVKESLLSDGTSLPTVPHGDSGGGLFAIFPILPVGALLHSVEIGSVGQPNETTSSEETFGINVELF